MRALVVASALASTLTALFAVTAVTSVAGCGDDIRAQVTVVPAARFAPVLTELCDETQSQTQPHTVAVGTAAEVGTGIRIDVVDDAVVAPEGYRIESTPDGYTVHASEILGAQYGTAAALEALGFRFRHPADPYVPTVPMIAPVSGEEHRPETRVRGMQIHTLHPIEGYFAFWEPSAKSKFEAHRIIDWLVKNRGNYLQWFALDDITDPEIHAAWKVYTRELIDYAHFRGIRVGLGFELFGEANKQQAFDLYDDRTGTIPIATEIAQRLPLVTDGLPFDAYDLSFGEFFNTDSQTFIDSVNEVKHQLATLAPQAEMHALIHVGAAQVVHYMNEDLIYYFLVKYADPGIISDVHTTMFYDLFETASGAYQAQDFSSHRDYLAQQMCAGRKPAYHPESAYWVAFDDSVPLFLPIYVHNRLLDLQKIRETITCAHLDNHLLFSTGWEWNYWLHDTATMRATYELPANTDALLTAELGTDLAPAKPLLLAMIDVQRELLHLGGMMAYMSGRDAVIDLGREINIISQPDRTTFDDLAKPGADIAGFTATVMPKLTALSTRFDAVDDDAARAGLPDSRWGREIRDGIAIDALRAHFVKALYESTLAGLAGDAGTAGARRAEATKYLDEAAVVVARRHGDLHDDSGRRLLDVSSNKTFYQYGYLHQADTLCYWHRELLQVTQLQGDPVATIPDCAI